MDNNLELNELSESSILDNEPILRKVVVKHGTPVNAKVSIYRKRSMNGTPASILVEDFDIPTSTSDLEAVYNIPVKVSAVLGKTNMKVSQLMKLNKGAIIELDRKVLADIAYREPQAFAKLVETAKAALAK